MKYIFSLLLILSYLTMTDYVLAEDDYVKVEPLSISKADYLGKEILTTGTFMRMVEDGYWKGRFYIAETKIAFYYDGGNIYFQLKKLEKGDRVQITGKVFKYTNSESHYVSIIKIKPAQSLMTLYSAKFNEMKSRQATANEYYQLANEIGKKNRSVGGGIISERLDSLKILVYKTVLKTDPDHEGARKALGYKRYKDKWMTSKEIREAKKAEYVTSMRAKGLIEFEGQWITPDEKRRIEAERKRQRQERKRYEAEQKAKGLVKIGDYWVTKKNAGLWSQFADLKRLRDEVIKLEKSNKKSELELAAGYEDISRLKGYMISLQQKADLGGKWLEKHKVSKLSPEDEIKKYNLKVIEYNKLGLDISKAALEIRKTQIYGEEKNKTISYNSDRFQTKKSEYIRKFSKFENTVMNSLSKAQGEQRKFLNPIAEEMQLLSKELMLSVIQVRKSGGGTFVKGVINDKLGAMFLVDTGATYVTISTSMAKQLHLDINSQTPREELHLADGSVRKMPIVILSSISLGGLRQNKVKAAVVKDSPGFTPLLGISFLKYFNWHFEGNKIVFKKWEFSNIRQEK